MSSRNRPKFNTESGLTQNGGGPAGERPAARKRNAAGSPRASALRGLFASGTAASPAASAGGSGGSPCAVDELAAPLGPASRNDRAVPVKLAAAAAADGVDTPDVTPTAQSARRRHTRGGRRVDAARANPFTPPADGTAAPWR